MPSAVQSHFRTNQRSAEVSIRLVKIVPGLSREMATDYSAQLTCWIPCQFSMTGREAFTFGYLDAANGLSFVLLPRKTLS